MASNLLKQRTLPKNLDEFIKNPGEPRTSQVVDKEHPNQGPRRSDQTVLQQHVEFFDRDNDGIINTWDTFYGFRELGFNILFSLFAVPVIHFFLSFPTQDSWIPDPLFRIYVKNIHHGKHGSDQEVYNSEGKFVPQKFEEMFSKFDHGNKGGLTLKELYQMTEASRNVLDPFGWVANKFEFGVLWLLAQKNGMISKDAIRGQYDGSLFYKISAERKLQQIHKQNNKGVDKKESMLSKIKQNLSEKLPLEQVLDKKKSQNASNQQHHHPKEVPSFIALDQGLNKKVSAPSNNHSDEIPALNFKDRKSVV